MGNDPAAFTNVLTAYQQELATGFAKEEEGEKRTTVQPLGAVLQVDGALRIGGDFGVGLHAGSESFWRAPGDGQQDHARGAGGPYGGSGLPDGAGGTSPGDEPVFVRCIYRLGACVLGLILNGSGKTGSAFPCHP